jgi:hypothetical protein
MKNLSTNFWAVVSIVLVIIICSMYFSKQGNSTLGSVGSDSNYSTTTPSVNSGIWMVKSGWGSLHTVVIGVTSATTFELRNATSTTDIASTTLLSVAASPAIGSTMTVDASFDRGLAIVFPASFTGRYTITWK